MYKINKTQLQTLLQLFCKNNTMHKNTPKKFVTVFCQKLYRSIVLQQILLTSYIIHRKQFD